MSADVISRPGPRQVEASAVAASYAVALAAAAIVGYFLLGLPVQLSDSYGNMLQLQTSWRDLLTSQFGQRGYLRPFLWAELKLVFDAAQGAYTVWYRWLHVVQVVTLVLLLLALLRPRTWRDAAVLPVCLASLFGLHTFLGTVNEAFPINTFMTIVLCCLAAANLALMRHRWWTDAAAVLLFVVAALTVESGLLVGVIVMGAALAGARGVSRWGVGGVGVLMAGYFVLRFVFLQVGAPGLDERSSGYGFSVLEPEELIQRFGPFPWGFYLYNIATSFLSVLFSEPHAGLFLLTRSIVEGAVDPALLISTIVSTLGTVLIGAFVWSRRRDWWNRRFDRDDVVVVLFWGVLAANAVLSFPYTKDVVLSPAGAFYAAALFVATRHVLFGWGDRGRFAPVLAAAVCGAVLSTGWAIRDVALHLNLRGAAYKTRNDWAFSQARDWLSDQNIEARPGSEALFRQLQDAVVRQRIPSALTFTELRIFELD